MAINDQRRNRPVDLKYPYEGLSETFAFSDQPVGTTRDERNMRCFDPATGRARGTQRAGLDVHSGDTPANGLNKVTSLLSVMREVNPYRWSAEQPVYNEAEIGFDRLNTSSGYANCVDLKRDTFDTYWALADGGEVVKLNDDGGVIKRIDVPVSDVKDLYCRRLAVDDFGNCFVASGQRADHDNAVPHNNYAWIKAYELRPDNTYTLAWTIKPGFHVLDLGIYAGDLYVWGIYYASGSAGSHNSAQWRFRRYPAYTFDEEPSIEPNSSFDANYDDTTTGSKHWAYPAAGATFTGSIAIRPDGDVYVCGTAHGTVSSRRAAQYWVMGRLSPISTDADDYQWWEEGERAGTDADEFGWGLSVQVLEKRTSTKGYVLWCCGSAGDASGRHHVSLWVDEGTGAKQAGVSFDESTLISDGWCLQATVGSEYIRTAIDENSHFYVPYHGDDSDSINDGNALMVYNWSQVGGTYSITTVRSEAKADLNLTQAALLSVAVPIAVPDYDTTSFDYVDRVVLGGTPGSVTDNNESISVLSLASAIVDDALAIREVRNVATCGGKWYEYGGTGFTELYDEDGNTITHNASAPYISAVTANGVGLYTDGTRYYYYSPKDRVIKEMRSSNNGNIPRRCRLISYWRGRVVLARSDEAPGAWHMSAYNKPFDYDEFPAESNASAAVSNITAKAGSCPDSINTIVPYKDDVLWFGCDHSIYQLSGDPGAGGSFDLVSDEIGMSFGKPWCKDDVGRLWFFGSKGGLYTLQPGGGMEDVSVGRIRKRMQNIDLETHYVELAYNYNDDGVHIFVMPFANPGIIVDHYFYDKRTRAFHVDRFGRNTGDGIQPTCVLVTDGDSPSDRVMVMGCEDGRIRKWGQTESAEVPKSDRVTSTSYLPIDSYVLMGPIAPTRDMDVSVVGALTVVLAPNYSGCNYEFYETDNAAQLGDPLEVGMLKAGRNGTHMVRVSGDSIYLLLRNAREQETWSYEKGQIQVSYGGGLRPS